MSNRRHRPPLILRPARSNRLLVFVCVVHASALLTLLPLPLTLAAKSALVLLILASVGYLVWSRILSAAPWSIVEAIWTETGWRLSTVAGQTIEARLCASTYVGVGLVILNLRLGPLRFRSLVFTTDNIDPEQLRRLRARLRLSRTIAEFGTGGRRTRA